MVHTDGTCEEGRDSKLAAGAGVWFAKNDPRNVSTPLGGQVQNSRRSELLAIVLAIHRMLKDYTTKRASGHDTVVVVKSNSKECVDGWNFPNNNENHGDWSIKKDGIKTGNHDLWNALHRQRLALRKLPHLRVRLEWAKGPCNEAGNRAATKLAAQAINNGASTGAQVPTTNWEAHIRAPEFVPRRTAFRKTKTNREAEMYDEWVVAQHVYVPKKGSLDDPKNWRSICVLDLFGTVVTSILAERIRKWSESNLPESQCGFRSWRGCHDAVWSVTENLKQRRKAGLTTWTAAVDLRTAFDSVSREAIFHILSRYGFPPHFISILKRFHTGTKLQGRVGAAEYEVQTKAGVRTGDTCGPDLFNICMMAIAELTVWPVNTVPEFRTSKYLNEEVEAFKMASVQYADDCILFSNTRKGLAKMVMAFKKTAKAVTGMCMHDAASQFPLPKDKSKTVCMVCPPPGVEYKDLDTTPLKLQEEDEETASYVHFEESVSYLGIIIHFDLGPTHAMKKRIALASARNWQYRGILNNRAFDTKVKGSILTATVLPMLLYGSEVWNPTVTQLKKVSAAWNGYCRAALRITSKIQQDHHIKSETVWARLGVASIHYYLRHRRLSWLGKIARMDMSRWPRKLLTSEAKVGPSDEKTPTPSLGATVEPIQRGGEKEDEATDSNAISLPAPKGRPTPVLTHQQRRVRKSYKLEGEIEDSFSVEKAPLRGHKARCRITGTEIQPRETRFKYLGREGSNPHYFTLSGMMTLLTVNPRLVLELNRTLSGLGHLADNEKDAVKSAISPDAVAESNRLLLLKPPILPVTRTPWECNRCGKIYKERRLDAERHVRKDTCTVKSTPTGRPKQQEIQNEVYGKPRLQTWVRDLRKDLIANTMFTAPEAGCKKCCAKSRRSPGSGKKATTCCDRCLVLNMIVAARDATGWDNIIYKVSKEEKGNAKQSASTSRRASKKRGPAGVWKDPRPLERLRTAVQAN